MRYILILCGAVLVAGLAVFVHSRTRAEHFGAPFKSLPGVAVTELLQNPAAHLDHDVRVEGEITRQCPATGCWFDVKAADGKQLRVELGELGMTLPQKTGRIAVVEGRLIKTDEGVELVGNGVEFH
jgi:hypothetical protein